MKKLLKVMVRKGPFDSQMQNLCVLRHHFLIYEIFGKDIYIGKNSKQMSNGFKKYQV